MHGGLIKKAQHLRRCVPCYVLTQGSSLCSPTLGYQKRNPDGVRQFANILCADLPFEMAIKSRRRWGSSILQTSSASHFLLKWLSKTEGDGGRLFCKHPLRPLFLLKWLSKAEGDGVHLFCKHPLPALPSPWRGVGGEALMLRLYSKLGIFLWFSLLFRIFHQT